MNLKVDDNYVNLAESRSAKSVEYGCPEMVVRVVSINEGGISIFRNVTIASDLELIFRFKTLIGSGLLASLSTDDNVC